MLELHDLISSPDSALRGKPAVIPTSNQLEVAPPQPLEQFEQELLDTSDAGAVLERYRGMYPELFGTFVKLADAIAMLKAAQVFRGGDARANTAKSLSLRDSATTR